MKIDNSVKTVTSGPAGEVQVRSTKTEQKSKVDSATDSTDRVELSSQLQDIAKSLASGEVFDAARVDEIKQAIVEGRFQINSGKVADGLLQTVRDLLQAGKA